MNKFTAILLLILLSNSVYAASGSYTPSVGGGTNISLPVSVANGGTGATAIGPCLSNSGSVLNTTQPAARLVTTSTDTITASDACGTILKTYSGAVAATIASASSAGFTQGFATTINNSGTGTYTLTPTASTINGAASFAIPSGTGCYIYSDGTNYQIDLNQCNALPITATNLPVNVTYRVVGLSLGGAGSVFATGVSGYYRVPFSGTITGYSVIADQSCSVVLDVWKIAGGSSSTLTLPTITNTITASALPTLSSAQTSYNTTLTGWTTGVSAGDVFGFNVNSVTTCTRVLLELYVTTN